MSFPPPAKKSKQSTLDNWKKKHNPVSNPYNTAQESTCLNKETLPSAASLQERVPTECNSSTLSKEVTNQKKTGSLPMDSRSIPKDGIDPTSEEETVWSLLSGEEEEVKRGNGSHDGSKTGDLGKLSESSSGTSDAVTKPRLRKLHPDFIKQSSIEEGQEQHHTVSRKITPISLGIKIKDLKTTQRNADVLPKLTTHQHHTVLTQLTSDRHGAGGSRQRRLAPDQLGSHMQEDPHLWHPDYVKMPFSQSCTITTSNWSNKMTTKTRWEVICEALTKPLDQFRDLKKAILSYNSTYKDLWTFDGLEDFLQNELDDKTRIDFFCNVLPKMAKLTLELPQLCHQPIPLLKRGSPHTITMSQEQAACLLANAFFCTFPDSNRSRDKYSTIPGINFSRLFRIGIRQKTQEKLKCLLHYFKTVTDKMPQGNITYSRQVVKRYDLPKWDTCNQIFPRLHISSGGTIEDDGNGMLQVDFANKYIGGGVLGDGSVQEEIRFVICPELVVSLLFTEVLEPNEAVVITGPQRYSNYKGYASSFEWNGGCDDETPRDTSCRRCTQVTAIDAVNVKRYVDGQFETQSMRRELNKAYVGFYDPHNNQLKTAVATGNWGCGAFGGDSRLKALIQLMAAAVAGRDVCYFTYHDDALAQDIYDIHKLITERSLTVGDVWTHITDYSDSICNYSSGGNYDRRSSCHGYGGGGYGGSSSAHPGGRGYSGSSSAHPDGRGYGGSSSAHPDGRGYSGSSSAHPDGRGYGGSSSAHPDGRGYSGSSSAHPDGRGYGGSNRKNVFEYIKEKVNGNICRHIPSKSGNLAGGSRGTSVNDDHYMDMRATQSRWTVPLRMRLETCGIRQHKAPNPDATCKPSATTDTRL